MQDRKYMQDYVPTFRRFYLMAEEKLGLELKEKGHTLDKLLSCQSMNTDHGSGSGSGRRSPKERLVSYLIRYHLVRYPPRWWVR